jgi:hypothetical protein
LRKTRKRQLLRDLAKAMNACEKAGIHPKAKHGVIFTASGYVVPFGRNDSWVVRTLRNKLGAVWL